MSSHRQSEGLRCYTNNGLDYVGGQGCTISIDLDLISWFDLDDIVVNEVEVKYEHSLFFINLACMQFEVGLKRVNSKCKGNGKDRG